MPYGRQMRGLGGIPDNPWYSDSWGGYDAIKSQANIDDDTVGNGIFDGPGAPPVQHAGSGVFEARYSEPGYLYRERLGKPSEVLDQTTGEPIIYHPNAGGSWHEDVLRTYRKFDVETPRYYSSGPYVPSPIDNPPVAPGVGQTPSDESEYIPYAIGGLLVGVAAAVIYKHYKK